MADRKSKILLRRCNELALRARGLTATNPNVGALVWSESESRILGEGWHRAYGEAHAEVNAIAKATRPDKSIQAQTIAVSLEPCNHYGKTPPCTETIIKHRLNKVVIDQLDPNSRMEGKSYPILQKAGLQVTPPANTDQGREVIQPFHIGIKFHRPFIRIKMAMSSDGFIGQPGGQVKISNAISDRWVHRLRNETQSIMVGTLTALNDNPSLTSRHGNQNHPIRIVPDRQGVLHKDLKIFDSAGQVIVCTPKTNPGYPARLLDIDPHNTEQMLHLLYKKCQVGSILVEGGRKLVRSILAAGMWDEIILIENTELELKTGVKVPDFPSHLLRYKIKFGTDTINFIKNPESR